jgi:hypothetical protein
MENSQVMKMVKTLLIIEIILESNWPEHASKGISPIQAHL